MYTHLAFICLFFTPVHSRDRLYMPPSLAENASLFLWSAGGNRTCDFIVERAKNRGFDDCGYYGNWLDILHPTTANAG